MKRWLFGLWIMAIGFGFIGAVPSAQGQGSLGPIATFSTGYMLDCATFSDDNKRLLTCEPFGGWSDSSNRVYVRNLETGQVELELSVPSVVDAYWNYDETRIVTDTYIGKGLDAILQIWDTQGNLRLRIERMYNYAWTSDGQWLVVLRNIADPMSIQLHFLTEIWNVNTNEMVASWDPGFPPAVVGDIFVMARREKIYFYSVSRQVIVAEFPFEERPHFSYRVTGSPDGSEIFVKGDNLYKYTVSTKTFKVIQPNPFENRISTSDDMTLYLLQDPDTSKIFAHEFATGRLLSEIPIQGYLEFGWSGNNILYTRFG